MRKRTLVGSSLIAASLLGTAIMAPPLHFNPVQVQEVKADEKDDLKTALDKLKQNLFITSNYSTVQYDGFELDLQRILLDFEPQTKQPLFGSGPGALDNNGYVKSNNAYVDPEALSNIFQKKFNGTPILNPNEQLALLNAGATFTSHLFFYNKKTNQRVEFKKDGDFNNINNTDIQDPKNGGATVTLQYDIIINDKVVAESKGEMKFDSALINIVIPTTTMKVKKSEIKDPKSLGIQYTQGVYNVDNLFDKNTLGPITSDQSGTTVVPDDKIQVGGTYYQKITLYINPFLGKDAKVAIHNVKFCINDTNVSTISGIPNILNGKMNFENKTFSYIRTIQIEPDKKEDQFNLTIADKDINLKANNIQEYKDFNNLSSVNITADGKSSSDIQTATTLGKINGSAPDYNQDVQLDLTKLFGNDFNVTNFKVNGKNPSELGAISPDGKYYTYNRKINYTPFYDPLTIIIPEDVNFNKVPTENDIKDHITNEIIKNTSGYESNSIKNSLAFGTPSIDKNGNGTEEVTIKLKDILKGQYDNFIKNKKIIINGSGIDESSVDNNGNYTFKCKITTSTPNIGEVQINAPDSDINLINAKNKTYEDVKDLITKSIEITGKYNSNLKNSLTFDKGTADKNGNYKVKVRIDLKTLLGNDYDDIINNSKLKINGNTNANITNKEYTYERKVILKDSKAPTVPNKPAPAPSPSPNKPAPSPSPAPSRPEPQPEPTMPAQPTLPENKPAKDGVQEQEIRGIVRVVADYAPLYNAQGERINDRVLSLNSAWKTDRKRILKINGEIYYRVSTDEYIKDSQVVFDYDYSYEGLQNVTNVTTLQTPKVVRVVIPNYISLWRKAADNQHMTKISDRNLAYNSEWKIDQVAVIDGVTFYRVSTNEWVKAVQVILVDNSSILTGDVVVTTLATAKVIKVKNNNYVNLWRKTADNRHLELINDRSVTANSEWKTDQIAAINGMTFYRVSTNEWLPDEYVTVIK
ncbi:SLAP domain-containing protein [Bombilactobacillus bombi]|uniref:SLAP domain-containing protein n=1 Tax=Bombilactobacillus bombi TaxID=1303590 RepID=UPI0015E5D44C|nr:SLAP domain-containing protein [Bombilactobacillus bombi]MBA1434461.1 hypothetical protein [Bombilactobacillus bombi]